MSRMFNQGVPEKIITVDSEHTNMFPMTLTRLLVSVTPTKSFKDLKSVSLPSILPGFSGCNNCAIHLNITYGKYSKYFFSQLS